MNKKVILIALVLAACTLIGFVGREVNRSHGGHRPTTVLRPVSSVVQADAKSTVATPSLPTAVHQPKSVHNHQRPTPQHVRLPGRTPWKAVYDELLPLARSGNATAAARLYRDTRACLGFHGAKHHIETFTLTREFSDSTPAFIIENVESRLAEKQQYLDAWRSVCSDVEQAMLSGAVYEATFLAADLGNRTAACNYVAAYQFQDDDTYAGMRIRDHYNEHVVQIINAGLKQGHWEMAEWLLLAYGADPYSHGRWLNHLIARNAFAAYTYTLLMQYGASSDGSEFVAQLAHYREIGNLTEQQVAAARVRAEDLYSRFFSQSPKPPEGQELSACNTH